MRCVRGRGDVEFVIDDIGDFSRCSVLFQMMNKEELEAEKLRLDIRDMRQPWLVRNFQGIVALSVAMATIGLGFYSGLFDAERATLELQKERLQKDIEQFTELKDSLFKATEAIAKVNDSLEVMAVTYRNEVKSQKGLALAKSIEVAQLQASLRPVAERASYLEKAVRDAQAKYSETKSKYVGELFTKLDSEHDLRTAVKRRDERIELLIIDTTRLRKSIKGLLNYEFISRGASKELNSYYQDVYADYVNRKNAYRDDFTNSESNRSIDSLGRLIDSMEYRMHLERIERK